ncbi:SMI1/KNR4 family protein [Spirosoma knui]
MSHLVITQVGCSLTPADLESAEEKLGLTLPNSYKEFLLRANGGIPDHKYYTWQDTWGETTGNRIDSFYSVDEMVKGNLYNRDYIPEMHAANLVMIADTWAALVVCIGVGTENFGKVFEFEHEPQLISENLDDFISGLREYI